MRLFSFSRLQNITPKLCLPCQLLGAAVNPGARSGSALLEIRLALGAVCFQAEPPCSDTKPQKGFYVL